MQYEQTTAHMEDSSNHSSISFEQTTAHMEDMPPRAYLLW